MKSKFFTDTQELDYAPIASGKVCVCLLMDRRAWEKLLCEAAQARMTTGEYMDQLMLDAAAQRRR